jgi:hypothetical protein
MSEKIPIVDNPELNPYLLREEIMNMEFQRKLFSDPIKQLISIKDNLVNDGNELEKIEVGVLESLEIIVECLAQNKYGFEDNIPEELTPLLIDDAEADEEAQEDAYVYWVKAIGLSKAAVRSWVIEKYHDFEAEEDATDEEALLDKVNLRRMLDKIEKAYESE